MTSNDPIGYYDPLPDLRLSAGRPIPIEGRVLPPPDEYLRGTWAERNWRNVPGPIYGAETDTCWVARDFAPANAVYEHETGLEFLYRQPRSEHELLAVLAGAWADPFGGWAADGDSHWTVDAVKRWWLDRQRIADWLELDLRAIARDPRSENPSIAHVMDDFADGLRAYQEYLGGRLRTDLRLYMFWLDQHRAPSARDLLPDLE